MSEVIWEVEVDENVWVYLPVESCRMIEEARAGGRRAILINDERNQPVRAFIDDFEECIETIGGNSRFRNIRHTSFPPIIMPSQVIAPPKDIKKRNVSKTRKLTVTEAYSRARMRMMHANDKTLSATDLVSDAKKTRKKRHDIGTPLRPHNIPRNIATAKTEFVIHEENDNFALSLLGTELPQRPSLGWVMQAALPLLPLFGQSTQNETDELTGDVTPRFHNHSKRLNIVARKRQEKAILWALAKKRSKSKKSRRAASETIQTFILAWKLRRKRKDAAVRIQRWTRWHFLRRFSRTAKKRNAKRKKKLARKAKEAAERARWTEAQLAVLVAIELAYGPPQNRSDWALRSTFVGGEGLLGEGESGACGHPKALKDIQVKWEEMHASGELDDLDLLRYVPPPVLDTILPPWHATRKSKKHATRKSKTSQHVELEDKTEVWTATVSRKSFAKQKQPIGFRGEVPAEYTSVAARFSSIQIS